MSKSLIYTILFHLLIGLLVHIFKPFGLLYAVSIIAFGLFYVIQSRSKNHEALLVCIYIVGAEVFLRMTGNSIINEYGKYGVILFSFIGAYYQGIKSNAAFFGFYLLFLFPGVILGMQELGNEMDTRKAIVFNISGPLALGISAMYTSGKVITQHHLKQLLLMGLMPILSMLAYVILFTPDLKEAIQATGSNFNTSGGFGPNQVSTILGLGMALACIYTLLFAKQKKEIIVFGLLTLLLAYRCLLTFSRGGFYTGLLMILIVMAIAYYHGKARAKVKISVIAGVGLGLALSLWAYTAVVTDGLLQKRYANEDALGRKKESLLTGREILMETELRMFFDHPIFGVGVGRVKEVRMAEDNIEAASHNEITRLLAEHGVLGLISILLLIAYPVFSYINHPPNRILIIFFVFWLLTINHAAMRSAAPGFIYALCLLKLKIAPDEA